MIKFFGIVLFMTVTTLVQANNRDSTGIARFFFPINTIGESVVKGTQAAMLYAHERSLTKMAVSAKYRDESHAFMPQLGRGEKKGVFSVDSYIKLNKRSAVWGNVEYTNGKIKDVCWNSTSDYLQLYPYILADSVGGNLSAEQYIFSGGYAVQRGGFAFGIKGHYRALHEYRNTDPRTRGIVSDFNAALSGGVRINGYLLGVNIGGRIYKQFLDVAFYNENGANTSEMQFTGLGSHYERFSGAGNYSSNRYKGNEYSATISITPCKYQGWYVNTGYGSFRVRRHLPTQNMVPLTSLHIEKLFGNVAYKKRNERTIWGMEASVVYERRTGTENIIDNGAGNVNKILGSLKMYKNENITAKIEEKVLINRHNYNVWFEAAASYYDFKAKYLFPNKELQFGAIVPQAEAGYVHYYNIWSFEFALRMAYSININGYIDIPEQHIDTKIRASFVKMYDRLSDSCFMFEPKLKLQREVTPKTAVFFAIKYGRFIYGCMDYANLLTTSLGVCF